VISTESHGPVTVLAIDRDAQRNALDIDHCRVLHSALDDAVAAAARVVVITGRGSSFCSGADLDAVYGQGFRDALYGLLGAIAAAPVVVLAAVNGPAIGAGTQLAIACDLRVADETAVFAVPTAALGLAVDPWTARRLAEVAGASAARRMLLAAERISAAEAARCGLVDHLGGPDEAMQRAEAIAALAPLSLTYSKAALNAAPAAGPSAAALEAAFQACWDSADLQEGRRARSERRPPQFEGR
jgi:enoyl-CoA hydratase